MGGNGSGENSVGERPVKIRRKKTVTTTDSHEMLVVRKLGREPAPMCPVCGPGSQMLTPAEAALRLRLSQRVLFRWVEDGLLHIHETADGGLFVCANQLNDSTGTTE